MATILPTRRQFVRLRQIGSRRRALLVEAMICLALARLVLHLVPFPRIARRLGDFAPPGDARAAQAGTPAPVDAPLARDVGWAVTRAARHAPFAAVCLPQAIAARVMLARRGIASVIHFGACAPSEAPEETHAWLNAAGVEVTGYPVARRFTEVACFV